MSFHPAGAHCVLKRRVAVWTALASVFSTSSVLHAQTAPVATLPAISVSGDTPSPTLLAPSATGTLLGLTPFETPASIEIISNEQLRARGATTVTDAITQAAGITAMRHPGNGGSSLSSRGFTDSNSVAQLYDGVRQYGGVGQTFMYDPWAVDSIEVLRGPASVLYGEGAIGGVVNVIPKKPTRGPIENEFMARTIPSASALAAAARWTTSGHTGWTSAATTPIPASAWAIHATPPSPPRCAWTCRPS
jgi:iron complex outermembrane receptor protein